MSLHISVFVKLFPGSGGEDWGVLNWFKTELLRAGQCRICFCLTSDHVKWVLYHHGIARPQFADRGDGLQQWRLDASTLNKQPRTNDKGWSSSFGVGRGTNNSSPYKWSMLQKCYKSLGLGRILPINDLSDIIWRSRAGSLVTVSKELSKYKLDLVGV
jgi:hypothetical protein